MLDSERGKEGRAGGEFLDEEGMRRREGRTSPVSPRGLVKQGGRKRGGELKQRRESVKNRRPLLQFSAALQGENIVLTKVIY